MPILAVLLIEVIFFFIMSGLFEYHWRNHDFDGSTLIVIRLWYYSISLFCFLAMAGALFIIL